MERSGRSAKAHEENTVNMLNLTHDIYSSPLLSKLSGVMHGYSTRTYKDARIHENAQAFVRKVIGSDMPFVKAQQVHGAVIADVTNVSPLVIPGADGLVTHEQNILLEVHVADCVPILFVDPDAHVCAVAHAGWKGTLLQIAKRVVMRMQEKGARIGNIRVSIGPHIGGCCYTVPVERVREFQNVFGNDVKIAFELKDGWHLDLGYINLKELIDTGIAPEHIDAPITCTSCQIDTFYSYRKSTKETFGEIIGVIGNIAI